MITPEQLLDEYLNEISPARLEPIEREGFVYISLDDFREYIINRTNTEAEDEPKRPKIFMNYGEHGEPEPENQIALRKIEEAIDAYYKQHQFYPDAFDWVLDWLQSEDKCPVCGGKKEYLSTGVGMIDCSNCEDK